MVCLYSILTISVHSQFIGLPDYSNSTEWLTYNGGNYVPFNRVSATTVETYVVNSQLSEFWINAPNHYNSDGRALPHKVTWSHSTSWRGANGYFKFSCPNWDVNTTSFGFERRSFVIIPQNQSSTIKLTWKGYNTHDYLYEVQYETLNPPTPHVVSKYTPRGVMYNVTWSPMMETGKFLYFKPTPSSPYQAAVNCTPLYNDLSYTMTFMTFQPITFYLRAKYNDIYTLVPMD